MLNEKMLNEFEWQPAILVHAHSRNSVEFQQMMDAQRVPEGKLPYGERVNIRLSTHPNIPAFRLLGCNAEKFYSVLEYPGRCVCEHEILTD